MSKPEDRTPQPAYERQPAHERDTASFTEPSTWLRLCPLGNWPDPVLGEAEAHLARPEVVTALANHDAARTYPESVIADLHRCGIHTVFTEEERATAYHLCRLNAASARAGGSLAISLGVNALALLPIYIAGTPAQRDRAYSIVRSGEPAALVLTEWEHGSDLVRIETRAERREGGFRLRGEKHLINGGRRARLLVTLARTEESGDRAGPFALAGGLSVFLVERDDTVQSPTTRTTLPAPAADISDVRFNDTLLDEEALLGAPGEGLSVIQRALTLSRGGIASLSAGAATAARDLAWTYAARRRIYDAPLHDLGAIRDHLLEVAALDAATSALAVKTAAAMNALGQRAGYFTATAKLACSVMAEEAVDEGRQVLGARALLEGRAFTRLSRDVLLYGVFDGTRHVMLEHLQGYLRQMPAPDRGESADTLAQVRELYGAPLRPLPAMSHSRRRAVVPPLARHARALSRLPGDVDLDPLADVADAVVELSGELGPRGRWAQDQGRRFALARVAARLEALVALAELGDLRRRDALGAAPMAAPLPFGEAFLQYALSSGALSCAARLRRLQLSTDIRPAADLDRAERAAAREREAARARLHPAIGRALGAMGAEGASTDEANG